MNQPKINNSCCAGRNTFPMRDEDASTSHHRFCASTTELLSIDSQGNKNSSNGMSISSRCGKSLTLAVYNASCLGGLWVAVMMVFTARTNG